MTSSEQRQTVLQWVAQARQQGARQSEICRLLGLSDRTLQRWREPQRREGDRRVRTLRRHNIPPNKLSEDERQAVLATLNSAPYQDLPPSQVVPRLADEGIYLASESTMLRLLKAAQQLTHRRAERPAQARHRPRALKATGPNQLYSWDITYLPTQIKGVFFYLYLFMDVFSRKIVGWQVFESERADLASQLLQDICTREGIHKDQLTLHSDNGAPMKGEIMLATLQALGVAHSRSRPAVSNDNPYSESLFKTLKYRPQFPVEPFVDIVQARRWVAEFEAWYNDNHRHSAVGFVTPSQRHAGSDRALLTQRHEVYTRARQANPLRWAKQTRDWTYTDEVHLNPDKDKPRSTTAS